MASASELLRKVRAGDVRAISRAATLIENQTEAGTELASSLFPYTGRALTVGITGPPGAGKSTLIDQLTGVLRRQGKTVGVIAVDPSSPFGSGAILGDRIRMQSHYNDPGVYLRSMATRGAIGGVAQTTFELALLLDAAGWDIVLIETVGVGQDEVEIARLTDVTVVVLVPGFGDDVQAIKAGIMEIADVFGVNKSDLPGADRLLHELREMQTFGSVRKGSDIASVHATIASSGEGVAELWASVETFAREVNLAERRRQAWEFRLREMIKDHAMRSVSKEELRTHAARVASRDEDPREALDTLLKNAMWP